MSIEATFSHYGNWSEQPVVVLDVETTGVTESDRVVQLGLARFEKGVLVDAWCSLVWSDVEIPEAATRIHGITTEQVASAPKLVELMPHIIRLSRGAQPAAYNAPFDKRFFFSELRRLDYSPVGLPILLFDASVPWLDPLVWARKVDAPAKGNKLGDVCARRGVPLDGAHDAKEDAVAAGMVLYTMVNDIGEMTMSELLRQQSAHADSQQRRFAAWRNRKDAAAAK